MEFKKFIGEDVSDDLAADVVAFLHTHLDEFRDSENEISLCLNYMRDPIKGGELYTAVSEGKLDGCVVINKTHMGGFIPENILVYIAVSKDFRGQGVGKNLMKEVIDKTQGDVALHVEPHNPAVDLYKKMGFTNKYLEMRYHHTK